MNKLNSFFFLIEEGEEMHSSDALWFYGTLGFAITLTTFVVLWTL